VLTAGCEITIARAGAGNYWWAEQDISTTVTDPWGIKSKPASTRPWSPQPVDGTSLSNTTGMQLYTFSPIKSFNQSDLGHEYTPKDLPSIEPNWEPGVQTSIDPWCDEPNALVMDMWHNRELWDWNTSYSPENQGKIRSTEQPLRVVTLGKTMMQPYPVWSRPVMTKWALEEQRTIAGVLMSLQDVRDHKRIPATGAVIMDMFAAYFRPDSWTLVTVWKRDLIVIEPSTVREWLSNRPGRNEIFKETINMLCGDICLKPISDVKIHLKLESLLKTEPITNWRQGKTRPIVWQRKAVATIYSAVFKQAKQRLKELLDDHVVYSDGLRPDTLAKRFRLCKNVAGFFENDLTKQDRQTDDPIIEVEMAMYELLGVHPDLLSGWKTVHGIWRYKASQNKGELSSRRLTGQATTALGNALTNMQVHAKFVSRNKPFIELITILGDDMLVVANKKLETGKLRSEIANLFNMQSKDVWNDDFGTFCQLVAYKTPYHNAGLGPDLVRLKRRYEVTNGQHEINTTLLDMRAQSYLCMIGANPDTEEISFSKKWKLPLVKWYDKPLLVASVAAKHGMSDIAVEQHEQSLLQYIREPKPLTYEFSMFTSKHGKFTDSHTD
jgi:hypothetical protein